MDVDDFIRVWSAAGISERSHYQTFITALCRLIGVPAPDDEQTGDFDYCFERPVRFAHEQGPGHRGVIDCYRRGCFVLEAKQSAKRREGGDLDPQRQLALLTGRGRKPAALSAEALERLMRSAMRQAAQYARALDEWPPFLIVVDVGRAIELWSDFGRQGEAYTPFPDRARYRITLEDLRDSDVRARLRDVWLNPMSLDPNARTAAVTSGIAELLAMLVKSLATRARSRAEGAPDIVERSAWASKIGRFVMQCIFAMFADSVSLIPDRGFLELLVSYRGRADQFHKGAKVFFLTMDQGGHCAAIRKDVRQFNGGLFRECEPLPINEVELEILVEAAERDWAMVEPAIFGTLLERALAPDERAELGAHYTPREFVSRLVEPTVMEPLRADWEAVEAGAIGRYLAGDARGAIALVRDFHRDLCRVRVLDPACGTGNFLYVAMDMMKALEGEILGLLSEMGETQASLALDGLTISPRQFLGIEKNPYAAWIAEMVMWIGYLQWHFRLFADAQPSEPILRSYDSIRQGDALLAAGRSEIVRAADDGAHTPGAVERYISPRAAEWPVADFIIGNPPFMGAKDQRRQLGDGYVDALWAVRQGRFRSADLVMAWWDRAAAILTDRGSRLRRFGFITTNSITQTFSRRVLEHHLDGRPPMRLVYAIADHPWLKGVDHADVRIAMTVAERGEADGQGRLVSLERSPGGATGFELVERRGVITAALTLNDDRLQATALEANSGLAHRGVQLMGKGFLLGPDRAAALSAGRTDDPAPLRLYRNGRDLADRPRNLRVIDAHGLGEGELRRRFPAVYQHLLETVKPERDRNKRASYRRNWWQFGEPRTELRAALEGLDRYIVTVETAKHRWFRFLGADILPDNKLVVIASDDPAVLAVLSSQTHRRWFVANSGRIGVYEGDAVYVKGACFDRFPFPDLGLHSRALLGELAEELDAHRSRVLADHDGLSMTELYNARARLVSGAVLSPEHRRVHEAGLVALLHHLHNRIDAVVADAYGWTPDLPASVEVARLAALNRTRVDEERQGRIRFIRPDFQSRRAPSIQPPVQIEAVLGRVEALPPLPTELDSLASVLLTRLRAAGRPLAVDRLAAGFSRATGRRAGDRIEQTLAILAVAGSVQRTDTGWFAPRRLD